MVKKILKYDLQSYIRPLFPAALIVLGAAILNRLIQFLENDSQIYGVIFGSSVVVMVLASLGFAIFTAALIVIRFYKGMFSREGYLTLTLPVTTNQHLFAKLLGAWIVSVASFIVILFGVMIATSGEYLIELFKAGGFLLKEYVRDLGTVSSIFMFLEVLLEIVLLPVFGALLFYFCLTVGQLAKSKRILAAVGIYFAIYFAEQLFATILLVLGFLDIQWIADLVEWMAESASHFTHTVFGALIFIQVVIGTIFYIVIHNIFEKKLNLE